MMPDWSAFRRQMPVVEQCVYLDHAACGPLPRPTRDAVVAYADDFMKQGSLDWPRFRHAVEKARGHLATLLNAKVSEVALVRNTTEGVGLVAEGLNWQPGDNVVIPASEFPSNLFPWRNLESRGVECRVVSGDVRRDPAPLAAACDGRTRVLTCSWVGYKNGDRIDLNLLREIADRSGADVGGTRLFIDAIQGLGMHPLDVRQTPVDFLAADGHKWLLGPEGAGVLFVREERLPDLRPLGVGWNSVQGAYEFDSPQMRLREDAARYEGGTYPAALMCGLAASLELLAGTTPTDREARMTFLCDDLTEKLRQHGAVIRSPSDAEHRSAIVSAELPGRDPAAVRRRGLDEGIVTSVRSGRLRLAPHVYLTPDDFGRAVDVLLRE